MTIKRGESKQTICLAVKLKDSDDIQGNDVDPLAFPDLNFLLLMIKSAG